MRVYVVTNTELGWDCVIGVFADIESYNEYSESDYTSWGDLEDSNKAYYVSDYDVICKEN
jgi:hypothetical protein